MLLGPRKLPVRNASLLTHVKRNAGLPARCPGSPLSSIMPVRRHLAWCSRQFRSLLGLTESHGASVAFLHAVEGSHDSTHTNILTDGSKVPRSRSSDSDWTGIWRSGSMLDVYRVGQRAGHRGAADGERVGSDASDAYGPTVS